jgi:type IV pilus assembly protein PilX
MRQARTLSPTHHPRKAPVRDAQRGVVLFIALIVLVAMTLVGLAVMRSTGGSTMLAGNLSFRQNATVSGDLGIEAAHNWLTAQGPITLQSDDAANGYYATWDTTFNPVTFTNWHNPNLATDAAGNRVQFVIHRMCAQAGPITGTGAPPNQECVTLTDAGKTGSKGGVAYGEKALAATSQPYYRITARIDGPKNTVSYVQAMMY